MLSQMTFLFKIRCPPLGICLGVAHGIASVGCWTGVGLWYPPLKKNKWTCTRKGFCLYFFLWLEFSELRTDPLSPILYGAAISDEIVLSNTFFLLLHMERRLSLRRLAQACSARKKLGPPFSFEKKNLLPVRSDLYFAGVALVMISEPS